MITKNFRSALQATVVGGSSANTSYKNINGTTPTYSNNPLSSSPVKKLVVGTNDTTPSIEDYSIDVASNLTGISNAQFPTTKQSYDENTMGFLVTGTFTNSTNENITIKEVGIYGYTYGNNPSANDTVLLIREVIEPVTIAPNDTYSFTIKVG